MDNKKKYIKIGIYLLLTLLLCGFIFAITYVSIQNDTFFDIKLGEKYIQGDFSTQDTFSIHEGLQYISHHFMVNIITYLVYTWGGTGALYVLLLGLTLLLSVILFLVNKKFVRSPWIAYVAVFVELLMISNFISIRAQMYSYVFFALEILWIECFLQKGKKRYLVLLSLIPIALANFHAGVLPFFYLILCCYFINLLRSNLMKIEYDKQMTDRIKYLWIPFVVGIVTMFINPYGYKMILYTFQTLGNTYINQTIYEFQAPTIAEKIGSWTFILSFIIMMTFIFTKKKIKWQHFLLCMGTMFMALCAIRHLTLFVIASTSVLPYIEELLERGKTWAYKGLVEKGTMYLNVILCTFVVVLIAGYTGLRIYKKKYEVIPKDGYPFQAVEYIKTNLPKEARIMNDYTWGSFLMFHDIPVFIDSRADLYTTEYNKGVTIAFDYQHAIDCTKNYNEILKKYDIDYLFLNKKVPLAQVILDHDGELMYEDELSYVIKYKKN